MQTNKILNNTQACITFTKVLLGDDDRIFKGTHIDVSPLGVIEEFETFNVFKLGEFEKMQVESDRIEVNYKNAILFLSW